MQFPPSIVAWRPARRKLPADVLGSFRGLHGKALDLGSNHGEAAFVCRGCNPSNLDDRIFGGPRYRVRLTRCRSRQFREPIGGRTYGVDDGCDRSAYVVSGMSKVIDAAVSAALRSRDFCISMACDTPPALAVSNMNMRLPD